MHPSISTLFPTNTHQLLNNDLDELSEVDARISVVDVLRQLGDHFRVRLRLELVSLLGEVLLDLLEVRDDSIVDDHELCNSPFIDSSTTFMTNSQDFFKPSI